MLLGRPTPPRGPEEGDPGGCFRRQRGSTALSTPYVTALGRPGAGSPSAECTEWPRRSSVPRASTR